MSGARATRAGSAGLDIGFVVRDWRPAEAPESWRARQLALALVARGHRVHVVARDAGDESALELRALSLAPAVPRTLGELAREPLAEEGLAAWVADQPCDVIHVLDPEAFGLGALRALAELGRPTVVSLDDYAPICPRCDLLSAAGSRCLQPLASACAGCLARTWPALLPSSTGPQPGPEGGSASLDEQAAAFRTRAVVAWLGRAGRLVVPSRPGLEPYVRMGLTEAALRVVEPGLDRAAFAGHAAAERGSRPGAALRLGLFGAGIVPSGALVALEAFAAARLEHVELALHVELAAARSDERSHRRFLELSARTPGVHVAAPVRASDLPAKLAGLDALLAPTAWSDPLALVARCARSLGLPLLASELGVLPQLTQGGRAGLVVASSDVAGWTAALRRFATDAPWRAALAAAAPETRDIADEAREFEGLYLEAMADGLGNPAPRTTGPRGFFGRLFRRS